jgi:hypothetical protein
MMLPAEGTALGSDCRWYHDFKFPRRKLVSALLLRWFTVRVMLTRAPKGSGRKSLLCDYTMED